MFFFCGTFSKKQISAKHISILFCRWEVAHDVWAIIVESCGSADIPAL